MLSHHSLTRENKRARHSEASRFHKIREHLVNRRQKNLCDLRVLCGEYIAAMPDRLA